MGNYHCYKQNEKIQIKSYEPTDYINIDNNEFFIDDSIEEAPLDYNQTEKGNVTISSFNQINNTNNTFQSKLRITKNCEENNINQNENQNRIKRQNSVKISKLINKKFY